jgi:RNA polymerase sigma-32 factor
MTESDAYNRYIRDISTYPRISPDREVELSRIIQTCGNAEQVEAAVSELIHANLRLVVHCQKEFEKYHVSVRITALDLIAEGNVGLMKAAQNYDTGACGESTDGPVRFSTYAFKCIKSHMIRAIKKARFIHIPEHHFGYWSEIETLQRENGNVLTDADLRERMDVSEEALALIKLSANSGVCMLEDLPSEGPDSSWNEFIASENTPCPDEEAEGNDLRAFLLQEMDSLAPRTRQIISMLYFNEKSPTLKDISLMFDISSERCRQICLQGLQRLKRQMLTRRRGISPDLAGKAVAA